MSETSIEVVSNEQRVFPPPEAFARQALVGSRQAYEALYARSIADPEGFFREQAELLHWSTPPKKVLEWEPPFAKWFADGTLNVADNCLDRHVAGARADKIAIIWEGEPGEIKRLTYRELLHEVCRFANVLKGLGVKSGDRVGIYLPMIPEAAVAMLACARIGAIHSVVFGGFSPDSLASRIEGCLPSFFKAN